MARAMMAAAALFLLLQRADAISAYAPLSPASAEDDVTVGVDGRGDGRHPSLVALEAPAERQRLCHGAHCRDVFACGASKEEGQERGGGPCWPGSRRCA